VWRVERKGSRRHFRHAHPALGAREPAREEPVAAPERVDHDDVVGEVERNVERVIHAAFDARLDEQPVDEHLDRVILAAIEHDVVAVERDELAVNPRARETFGSERRQILLELALPAAHDGRQHVDPLVRRRGHHQIHDALDGLCSDFAIALGTVQYADVGGQESQVVVDLGDRANRRARIGRRRLLLDRDGGRQSVDQIDVWLLHLLEKLARVGRERLHVAPLPFRVDRVEGQRRLAGPAEAGDDHQPIARQIDVDPPEVVDAGAADGDPVVSHGYGTRDRARRNP
jgi:hypothetical protein